MEKSIEKTRYHRHYMIDHHEAHLIVISSDRLESRAYTVLLVPGESSVSCPRSTSLIADGYDTQIVTLTTLKNPGSG